MLPYTIIMVSLAYKSFLSFPSLPPASGYQHNGQLRDIFLYFLASLLDEQTQWKLSMSTLYSMGTVCVNVLRNCFGLLTKYNSEDLKSLGLSFKGWTLGIRFDS